MQQQSNLEREFLLQPGYDLRSENPKKNYGVGSVRGYMSVKGPEGAVVFSFMSGIYPHHVMQEWVKENNEVLGILKNGMGMDVGSHKKIPHYEGQSISQEVCNFIGVPCYYDGSSLRAMDWFEVMLEHGYEVIFEMLEKEYKLEFKTDDKVA